MVGSFLRENRFLLLGILLPCFSASAQNEAIDLTILHHDCQHFYYITSDSTFKATYCTDESGQIKIEQGFVEMPHENEGTVVVNFGKGTWAGSGPSTAQRMTFELSNGIDTVYDYRLHLESLGGYENSVDSNSLANGFAEQYYDIFYSLLFREVLNSSEYSLYDSRTLCWLGYQHEKKGTQFYLCQLLVNSQDTFQLREFTLSSTDIAGPQLILQNNSTIHRKKAKKTDKLITALQKNKSLSCTEFEVPRLIAFPNSRFLVVPNCLLYGNKSLNKEERDILLDVVGLSYYLENMQHFMIRPPKFFLFRWSSRSRF